MSNENTNPDFTVTAEQAARVEEKYHDVARILADDFLAWTENENDSTAQFEQVLAVYKEIEEHEKSEAAADGRNEAQVRTDTLLSYAQFLIEGAFGVVMSYNLNKDDFVSSVTEEHRKLTGKIIDPQWVEGRIEALAAAMGAAAKIMQQVEAENEE